MKLLRLFLFLLATPVLAATPHFAGLVSAGGNTGVDWNNRWALSGISWGSVAVGDTVFVQGGTYSSFTAGKAGTAGNLITIQRASTNTAACTGAAGWSAAFDARIILNNGFDLAGFSYVRLSGLTPSGIYCPIASGNRGGQVGEGAGNTPVGDVIDNVEFAGPNGPESYGIWAGDSTGAGSVLSLSVSNCAFHGLVNGYQCYNVSGMLNLSNQFYNIQNGSDGSHGNIFYITGNSRSNVWLYCAFYPTINSLGIAWEDGAVCDSNVVARCWWTGGTALQSGPCSDSNGDTIKSFYLYNDTFVNCPFATYFRFQIQGGAFENNIYWNTGLAGVAGAAAPVVFDYNYYKQNASDGGTHTITNGVFPFIQSNSFQIVSTVAANLPAQKGVNLGAPWNVDANGVTAGVNWDIGAFNAGSSVVQPTVYYVSPSGNSANNGTSTNSPWPMAFALSNVGASNTIIMMDGTYGSFSLGTPSTQSGLTIQALNKWSARILGSPNTFGIFVSSGVSNVTFDGLQIDHSWIDGIKLDHPSRGHTVRNCWIHNSGQGNPSAVQNGDGSFTGQGILSEQGNRNLFERNLIEHGGEWINHDHGMYLSGTNLVVRNNVVRSNLTWGIQMFSDSPFENMGNVEYDNIVYGNGKGMNCYSYSGFTNSMFNNTVYSLSDSAIKASDTVLWATNNIILPTGANLGIEGVNGAVIRADYNLSASSLAPNNGPHDVVSTTQDFVKTNTGLYWLNVGSPARSAALGLTMTNWFNASAVRTDIGAVDYTAGLASDSRVLDPSPAGGADYWTNISSGGGVAPTITVQPVGTNIQVSQGFTLSVAVSGTPPFNYQWTNSGVVKQNGSTATYTVNNAQVGDSGNYGVIVTNNFGTAVSTPTAAVNVTNPAVPLIAITPAQLLYGVLFTNTTQQLSFTIQNVGSGTLSNNVVITNSQFTIISGQSNLLTAGQSATVTIQFNPTTNSVVNGVATCTAGTNVNLSGVGVWVQNATNMQPNLSTEVQGMILSSSNTVYQSIDTSGPGGNPTNSAIVYFGFSLPNPVTNAALYALVNAPNASQKSFWLTIDGFPQDPENIWDVTNFTSGLELRPVSQRGNGTFNADQFPTNTWSLGAGQHMVIVCGREANVQLGTMQLLQQVQQIVFPPNITTQPVSQNVTNGTPVSFFVVATGTIPLAYQWNFNGSPINGANQTSYSIASTLPVNQGQYSCTVTNIGGSQTSFAATLNVQNTGLPTGYPSNTVMVIK